jgi:hypothetical protein
MTRPLSAFDKSQELARDFMHILSSTALQRVDAQQRESFNRVFWVSSTLFHALQAILKTHPIGLRQYHDMVPLPLPSSEREAYYYFFAQASLRRLLTETLDVVGYRVGQIIYAPVVAKELYKQAREWYEHLPGLVQFPMSSTPVFDLRKAFLRYQFGALHAVIFWPSVLQLLEKEALQSQSPTGPETPATYERQEALKTETSSCLTHCALCCDLADEILMNRHVGLQFTMWA